MLAAAMGRVVSEAHTAGDAVLVDLLVVLVAAAIVTMILQRIRLATIPGYLITGAIIGPSALKLVSSPCTIEEISHLAIVLLMFGVGLQLHLSALRHRLGRMVLLGLLASTASIAGGIPIALLFGLELPAAIAICMAFSLSSTAVVLRVLSERGELHAVGGRLCLSILVVQDIAVLAMFAAVPTLAKWAGGGGIEAQDAGTVWQGVAGWQRLFLDQSFRFGGVVLLIFVFRWVAPLLLREALRSRSVEVLAVVSLAAALSLAAAVKAIGFSLEMGAFLAGFLLASTQFRHHLTGQIRPLRDILIAVFFTAVGMKLDLAALADGWWVVLLAAVALIVAKSALTAASCWMLGTTAGTGLAVGAALAQAGEFSLVFVDMAHLQGVLSSETATTAIAIVIVSLIATPPLVRLGPWLRSAARSVGVAPWYQDDLFNEAGDAGTATCKARVVVAGFGLVGRCIVDNLEDCGFSVMIVELNHQTVRKEAAVGRAIVFGDVSSEAVLDSVDIESALALILTIPDAEAAMHACAAARRRCPTLRIVARTSLVSRSLAVARAGADDVAVDEMACADAMLQLVLARLVPSDVLVSEPPMQSASPVVAGASGRA